MSKKLAGGADAILLDVKVGLGAFVPTLPEAETLARLMVDIGRSYQRQMTAVISDMNQPLGRAVGNALELKEAIETLRGAGPADFRRLVITLAGHMLHMAGRAPSPPAGSQMAERAMEQGSAWEKFRQFIRAQGGDVTAIEDPRRLPQATHQHVVAAPRAGYLRQLNAMEVGLAAARLGAGREKKGDAIDLAVGVICHVKVGEWADAGAPLFTIHANRPQDLPNAAHALLAACAWSDEPVAPPPLIHRVIA